MGLSFPTLISRKVDGLLDFNLEYLTEKLSLSILLACLIDLPASVICPTLSIKIVPFLLISFLVFNSASPHIVITTSSPLPSI